MSSLTDQVELKNRSPKKVLVTGGAGYIGSHTVQKLIDAGFSPVVFDNLSTGFKEAIPTGVPFIQGDVLDTAHLIETFREYQIAIVIHFAGKLIVPESVEKPLLYYQNNTTGVLSLIQAMQAAQVGHLVFSSTAAVYGNQSPQQILHEDLLARPESPYGWSKYFSERIIQDAEAAYGIRAVILRYFNVASASVDGTNGQRTRGATHLIKVATEAALGKRQ